MKRLLLRKFGIGSAPGDIMVMTAAVESLVQTRPDEYRVSVQTACHEIWEGNPAVDRIHSLQEEPEGYDEIAVVHYDHIHGAQERNNSALDPALQSPGCSFTQAFTWGIGRALGIDLSVRRQRPVAYLTKDDQNWLGRFRKEHGDGPFVLLSPSIKSDTTVKAWPVEHYQAVVDHFQGQATFLQLGDPGCWGCDLTGVVNLVGKTSLRNVLTLASYAKAGLGPVTFLLHACAAFNTPYVCLVGGREQPSWIAYPHVQWLHTLGELDCCKGLACWKQRVIPLPAPPYQMSQAKAEEWQGLNANVCSKPVLGMKRPVAQCMHDISPEQVIGLLERQSKNWRKSIVPQPVQVPKEERWEGMGDVVASLTKAVGIKPCKGCDKRRQAMNRWLPFRKRQKLKKRPYLQRRHGMFVRKKMEWDKHIADEKDRDEFELRKLRNVQRVVDVGAHIGSFALQCFSLFGEQCEVVCVEPSRRNIPLLALNLQGLPATIVPAAMCYADQPLLHNGVFYGGHSGGSSIVPEAKVSSDPYRLASEVPTTTLESVLDLMGWESIDLLKLDCEGSEFDILEHANLVNVRTIVGEWHNPDRFYASVGKMGGKWRIDVIRSGGIGLFRATNLIQAGTKPRPPARVSGQ